MPSSPVTPNGKPTQGSCEAPPCQARANAKAANRCLLQDALLHRDPWRETHPGVMRSIFQTLKRYEKGHWHGHCSPLHTQNVKQRTRIRTAQMSHAILQTCNHCWAGHVKVKCLRACRHCWAWHAQVKLLKTGLCDGRRSRPLTAVHMAGRFLGEANTQASTDYQRRAFLAPYLP